MFGLLRFSVKRFDFGASFICIRSSCSMLVPFDNVITCILANILQKRDRNVVSLLAQYGTNFNPKLKTKNLSIADDLDP